MRIVHAIAGTREDHGGTSRSVPAICDSLSLIGADVHLITGIPADDSVTSNFPSDLSKVHTVRESSLCRQWGVVSGFREKLRRLSSNVPSGCLVHDHGVWLGTNHGIAAESRRLGIKRVVSPRGMLSSWSLNRRRLIKKLIWMMYQKRDLISATAFHATSFDEAKDIRALGLRQPIAVVPNGVIFPTVLPERSFGTRRDILFLSRIHPKKGLLDLVNAFAEAKLPSNWHLIVAGPDEGGYQSEVERQIELRGLRARVSFTGPVDDHNKWKLYCSADLFILPSYSENFGIAVAEAMVAGLPVITTTSTPWKVLQERNLGWWVEPNVVALTLALQHACSLERSQHIAMGLSASAFARGAFDWLQIGAKIMQFYSCIITSSTQYPDYVVTA